MTSPEYLFRVEPAPPGDKPGSSRRVGDLELASRLSFFLWSSIPDDELLQVAAHGKLSDPVILEKQVRRMLADTRSDALCNQFRRAVALSAQPAGNEPGFAMFPNFDDNLRQGLSAKPSCF